MKPTVILTAALLCVLSPISFAKPLKVFILSGREAPEAMDGAWRPDYPARGTMALPGIHKIRLLNLPYFRSSKLENSN
jgi:hypothetical protein